MSESSSGPLRPGHLSVQASPADGADPSAKAGKGLAFPTGTADHLFGEKKLVQVLTADSRKAATSHSWSDRLFKGNDGLTEKAEHAEKLFDNIQFHRGGQKGDQAGKVTAYNALVLLTNILHSAKAKAIAVIEASLDHPQSPHDSYTFTLKIGDESFRYMVADPGRNMKEAGHLEQLQELTSVHHAVKSRLALLDDEGDAQTIGQLWQDSFATVEDARQRQSLVSIAVAVNLSYGRGSKQDLTALASIGQKLETLAPWLSGQTPDSRARALGPLAKALEHSGGENTGFAVAVANLLVGKGLLAPLYRGPNSLDEYGDEIPPPPPLPAGAGVSQTSTASRERETTIETYELDRIDEETRDDLMRERSPSEYSQRGLSFSAKGAPQLPPPPDSDDDDDMPPPPPPPLPRSKSDYTVEDKALPLLMEEEDDEGPPPPPSGSAEGTSAANRALFDAFFGLQQDGLVADDSAASHTPVPSGFRRPGKLTELDDEVPTAHLNPPPLK